MGTGMSSQEPYHSLGHLCPTPTEAQPTSDLGTWGKEAMLPGTRILPVVPAIMAGALMPVGC